MTTTPNRRRRVQVDAPTPAAGQTNAPETSTIEEDVLEAWRLKSMAASAEKAYKDAMEALDQRMKREKRKELEVSGLRDRPPLVVNYANKTMSTIDAKGFQRLVSPAIFLECVKIGVTEARKHATETQLKKITTEVEGTPYIQLKPKPKGK